MPKSHWGKRRLNKIWWTRNWLGEYFVFGEVGSGKNSVVTTLAHRKTRKGIINAKNYFLRYVGRMMNEVPVK